MTTESLWVDLDDYLKQYFIETMGEDSDFTTLQLQDVFCTIIQDINDFEDRPKPSLAIVGRNMLRRNGGHGDGEVHYDRQIPYLIVFVTEGDQETAVRDAKILDARAEKVIRDLRLDLIGDDGTAAEIVGVSNSKITKYKKKPDITKGNRNFDTENNYYALSAIELLIESTV